MTTFLILVLVTAAAGSIYAIWQYHRRHATHVTAEERARLHVRWHELEAALTKGGPTNLRHVVIEGDKLVDHAMKHLGAHGETMGERLRSCQSRFTDYDGIWKAHKLRNQLVHELDRELLSFEAKQMMQQFKQALTDLGAL